MSSGSLADGPDRGFSLKSLGPMRWFFLGLLVFFGLEIVGLEVTGGDPDRFFRPLKSELTSSLRQLKLPLWSDRFGFGMPLAGQSEIGAFYPLHWLVYPLFGPGLGWRVSMVLHQALAAFFLYKLARRLGADTMGAALGSLIYLFGGFPTIQASKEWAVLGMAWIPAAFLGVETWFQEKSRRGITLLVIALACLALVGHFQLAQITSLGLFFWVLTRTLLQRELFIRWPGLIFGVVAALMMASPQLVLSWQYASEVEATNRSAATLSYYSYPLWNFTELVLPLWTRLLAGGPEGAYWTIHQTTQFEACQFFGTAGLLFAIAFLFRSTRYKIPTITLACVSIILSTMPQWSPGLYQAVLGIPGMGLFRCPSRYGVLIHLVMAIMAGIGFSERISRKAWIMVITLVAGSLVLIFQMQNKGFSFPGGRIVPRYPVAIVFGASAISWAISLGLASLKSDHRLRNGSILGFASLELLFYFFAGPTHWGWSLHLPDSSPAMVELREKSKSSQVIVAGPLDNMPVTARLTTAAAYFGVTMPPANESLKSLVESINKSDAQNQANANEDLLIALGVTHQIRFSPDRTASVFTNDPIANVILKKKTNRPLYLIEKAFGFKGYQPPVWLASEGLKRASDQKSAFADLCLNDQRVASFVDHDLSDSVSQLFSKLASKAGLEFNQNLDELHIKHQGPVIVIVRRTFDKGWIATDGSGNKVPILPVFGGLQAILVDHDPANGPVETVIKLNYWPASLIWSLPLAFSGVLICLIMSRR